MLHNGGGILFECSSRRNLSSTLTDSRSHGFPLVQTNWELLRYHCVRRETTVHATNTTLAQSDEFSFDSSEADEFIDCGQQYGTDMNDDANIPSDQTLITEINLGDHEAFTILYHRYRGWVLSLALRFTGHHDDALDVLQETFAYLVRKFPGFVLTARMTTFLYPAVRNLSIAARQRRQRATSSEQNMDLFPRTETHEQLSRDDMADALRTLSDAHREVLLMRFIDDMTQPEIATALDLPLGTVKSRLHHAIQAVKQSPVMMALMNEP